MEILQPYLDAYSRASDRTRSVYFIILAFSVVCVAAFLNSCPFGWNATGAEKCKLAYASLLLKDAALKPSQTRQGWLGSLTPDEEEQAHAYILAHNIKTLEEAKTLLTNSEKRFSDAKVVEVPIFGLSFHVNDLGFVAGLSLTFLMLVLKYSLTREIQNLQLVQSKANTPELNRYAYEMLSASEVLHRPQSLTGEWATFSSKPIIDAPILLVFLPVLCYAVVVASDYQTAGLGQLYSYGYTAFIMAFELLALVLLTTLSCSCFLIINFTRSTWKELHNTASQQIAAQNSSENRVLDVYPESII